MWNTLCSERGFPGGIAVRNLPTSAGDTGEAGVIYGWGRAPGVENGSPLLCSCLENNMDRGAWWAAVYRVAKIWTQLRMHARLLKIEILHN